MCCVLPVGDFVPFRGHPVYENAHVHIYIVRECVLVCVCAYCLGVCFNVCMYYLKKILFLCSKHGE